MEGIEELTLESLLTTEATNPKNKKYVFIRLYNIAYWKSAVPVNVLKTGIKVTGSATDDKFYNHAAMNTSLNDGFPGLSMRIGKNNLEKEYIAPDYPKSYPYMHKNGNPAKSTYIVLAVPVTEEEYEDIKKILNFGLKNPKLLKWDIPKLFGTLGFRMSHTDIQSIAKKNAADEGLWSKMRHEAVDTKELFDETKKNKFVCSTFVAYVLSKGSKRMASFFKKYEFDPGSFAPNDLTYIPFAKTVASGTWDNYNTDIDKAVAKNPEYSEYWKGGRYKRNK